MLDLELEDRDIVSNASIVSVIIDNFILPNEVLRNIFTVESVASVQYHNAAYIAMQIRKNNELPPKPFQIFLSGGAGVGKCFLATAITEYLKRVLRYPSQNLDQPSVFVTASTGKTATDVNDITLYSAFHLVVKSRLKSYGYNMPSNNEN